MFTNIISSIWDTVANMNRLFSSFFSPEWTLVIGSILFIVALLIYIFVRVRENHAMPTEFFGGQIIVFGLTFILVSCNDNLFWNQVGSIGGFFGWIACTISGFYLIITLFLALQSFRISFREGIVNLLITAILLISLSMLVPIIKIFALIGFIIAALVSNNSSSSSRSSSRSSSSGDSSGSQSAPDGFCRYYRYGVHSCSHSNHSSCLYDRGDGSGRCDDHR